MSAVFSAELAKVTDKLDRATDEIEAISRLLTPRLLSRKEAARLVGVSSRTIQRYEDRDLIQRAPTKGGEAFYAYDDCLKLRRMVK